MGYQFNSWEEITAKNYNHWKIPLLARRIGRYLIPKPKIINYKQRLKKILVNHVFLLIMLDEYNLLNVLGKMSSKPVSSDLQVQP